MDAPCILLYKQTNRQADDPVITFPPLSDKNAKSCQHALLMWCWWYLGVFLLSTEWLRERNEGLLLCLSMQVWTYEKTELSMTQTRCAQILTHKRKPAKTWYSCILSRVQLWYNKKNAQAALLHKNRFFANALDVNHQFNSDVRLLNVQPFRFFCIHAREY